MLLASAAQAESAVVLYSMSGGGVEAPEDEDMPSTTGAQQANIIFVLENASLETAHVGKVSKRSLLCKSISARTILQQCGCISDVAATQHAQLRMHMQTYQLLNCDDHGRYLGRMGKDPAEYRPDICHQVCGAAYVAQCPPITLHQPSRMGSCRRHCLRSWTAR